MKCIDPVLCYTNAKGVRAFRHFSLASPVFKRIHDQVFDCGKCIHCRKKRSTELASRCVLHASLYQQNCFLTLTYDEKKEGYNNEFSYRDIQTFKKRLRECVRRETKSTIEIFNVHEYGKNGKKHWHLIVFNWCPTDRKIFTYSNGLPLSTSESLQRLWPHGFSTIGDVSEASAMYQSQYMEKDFRNQNAANSKKSHSKHSGIGKPYFLKHYNQILRLGYIPFGDRKMPIPRYFQRLAHKHYSHFYETDNFFDTKQRKKLYTPFKIGEENKEIADLYIYYSNLKQEFIEELHNNWNLVISQHLTTKLDPDFIKSGQNTLHDLFNRFKQERF